MHVISNHLVILPREKAGAACCAIYIRENVWNENLRDLACRTIFTQHPLHVISGGWSLGKAV